MLPRPSKTTVSKSQDFWSLLFISISIFDNVRYSGVQYITWEDGNKVWPEAEVCKCV